MTKQWPFIIVKQREKSFLSIRCSRPTVRPYWHQQGDLYHMRSANIFKKPPSNSKRFHDHASHGGQKTFFPYFTLLLYYKHNLLGYLLRVHFQIFQDSSSLMYSPSFAGSFLILQRRLKKSVYQPYT